MKVKCINVGYLKQLETSIAAGDRNDHRPSLKEGEIYEVKEVLLDSAGYPHYDVGLKSNLNWIRSIHTGEELERGEEIHWCHPSRFEQVPDETEVTA